MCFVSSFELTAEVGRPFPGLWRISAAAFYPFDLFFRLFGCALNRLFLCLHESVLFGLSVFSVVLESDLSSILELTDISRVWRGLRSEPRCCPLDLSQTDRNLSPGCDSVAPLVSEHEEELDKTVQHPQCSIGSSDISKTPT